MLIKKLNRVIGRLRQLPRYLLHGLWALPVVFAIRALRPFRLIRFGVIQCSRVGHFAADVGQRKARDQVRIDRDCVDWYYFQDEGRGSNAFWRKVAHRWFKVNGLVRYIYTWNQIFPFGDVHKINIKNNRSRDLGGYLEKAQLTLPTTSDEEQLATAWMQQFGWVVGDPFVCVMVRDSEYLCSEFPEQSWTYHSYRDSDIHTYIKAIDYLTSQNVFVFRMGKQMANPMNFKNPKFIDYAFRKDKSDFLDVWLFSNCDLCITTGCGPDMFSDVFRRPILALNFLPLQNLWSWSNALHYPKILRWQKSQRLLSSYEYLTHAYYSTEQYCLAGIDIQDLTEAQIFEAVREAWERVTGSWIPNYNDLELEREFKNVLISHPDFERYHGFLHPETRLASAFLNFLRQLNTENPAR